MIRVRTSTLEQFRRVLSSEWASEEELEAYIRAGQTSEPNWMMRAGTEWHSLLASEAPGVVRYGRDHDAEPTRSFRFDGDTVLAARKHVGPGLCEVHGSRVFSVGGYPVMVDGTVDHIRGLVIQDHKTKFSYPDARDYEASLQWRMYLMIHECDVFRYNLFHFAEPRRNDDDPDPGGFCELKETVSFKFWRHPTLEQDCCEWLQRFLDWLDTRGIAQCLQPKRAA